MLYCININSLSSGELKNKYKQEVIFLTIQWIFFDLGNTLIDEEKAQKNRIKQLINLFNSRGISINEEDIIKELELASYNFAPRIIRKAIENIVEDKDIADHILSYLNYKKSLEKPYSSTREVLKYLNGKYKIGVIANQSKGTKSRLKKYDLDRYISLLFSSAEVGLEKPDPKIFKLALKKANCAGINSMMIGDRLDNDIAPANKIGMKTIRVLKGFHKVQKPNNKIEKPDYSIKDLNKLKEIL